MEIAISSTLEKYLHEHIPLSSTMGIKVKEASSKKIVLSAPLFANINHKKTAFGGSLSAVATLACWSLLYVNLSNLSDNPYEIVITESHIKYLKAIQEDFEVDCQFPSDISWNRFIKTLLGKSKSRIELTATIKSSGQLAVSFRGTFAAIKRQHQLP